MQAGVPNPGEDLAIAGSTASPEAKPLSDEKTISLAMTPKDLYGVKTA